MFVTLTNSKPTIVDGVGASVGGGSLGVIGFAGVLFIDATKVGTSISKSSSLSEGAGVGEGGGVAPPDKRATQSRSPLNAKY